MRIDVSGKVRDLFYSGCPQYVYSGARKGHDSGVGGRMPAGPPRQPAPITGYGDDLHLRPASTGAAIVDILSRGDQTAIRCTVQPVGRASAPALAQRDPAGFANRVGAEPANEGRQAGLETYAGYFGIPALGRVK